MIADDMMSYIKNDIIVFGIGVFHFYNFNSYGLFLEILNGFNAINGLCNLSNYNDWIIRFNWMESHSNFLKFYCFNAYFKYGNEYSCYSKIYSIKKRVSSIKKDEAVFEVILKK